MVLTTTLSAERQSSRDRHVDSVCLVVSWVREVDEVGDVVCVVYLCDDEVLVESSVDVAVSGVDLVSVDEGRCQFL